MLFMSLVEMKNLLNKLSSVSFVDRDKVTVIKFLQKSSLPSFFFFLKANYFGKPYYQI